MLTGIYMISIQSTVQKVYRYQMKRITQQMRTRRRFIPLAPAKRSIVRSDSWFHGTGNGTPCCRPFTVLCRQKVSLYAIFGPMCFRCRFNISKCNNCRGYVFILSVMYFHTLYFSITEKK